MYNKLDIRDEIENAKIGIFHWKIGILIGIIMFFDGYDLFNAAYVIPLVMKTWKPSASEVGMMLSSGIFGLSIGSVVQGILADRYGRRRVMLIALYLLSATSLLLATAVDTPLEFSLSRAIMGISIGMVAPLSIAYINEWTPRKVANQYSIWVFTIGFSLGGVAAGAAGILLTPHWGWQGLYILGTLTVIAAVLAHVALPESPQYLALHNKQNEIRILLSKLRPERVAAYQNATLTSPPRTVKAGSFSVLFSSIYCRNTLVVWLACALSLFCTQGLTGWLPSIMVQRGEAMSSAFAYGSLLMLSSMFGGIASGWLADKLKSRTKAMMILYTVAGIAIVGLGLSNTKAITVILVAAAGFFVFGAQSVLNNFIAMSYHTEVRSTGVGIAIGVGRIGGVLGPMVIGAVQSYSMDPLYTFLVLSLAMILAALSFLFAKGEATATSSVPAAAPVKPASQSS